LSIPQLTTETNEANSVEAIIRLRRTSKVLGDVTKRTVFPTDFDKRVMALIETAGHAPFHFPAHNSHRQNGQNSVVPWRFYVCDSQACNLLIDILNQFDAQQTVKLRRMLAAAGSMVIVTWLPDPSKDNSVALTQRNVEHIAAASCATQNLLLAATAQNIANYWSSGGVLRSEEVYTACGIPTNQAFLGAIFLFPVIEEIYDVLPGALRDKQGEISDWMSIVSSESLRQNGDVSA